MRVKPAKIISATIILAVLAGGYLFVRARENKLSPPEPEKVTIAFSTATDTVLATVAQKLGYYRQEGLQVVPLFYPYGKLALREVLDGKADFATVAETPVAFAIMKGANISIIATIQTSNKDNAIVARKGRGISSPGDLKGKTIAMTSETRSDFFLDAFLAARGISRGQVKVVDLKQVQMQNALADGLVDAGALFNPYLLEIKKKLGGNGITFEDEDIYTLSFNIVAKQEFIGRHPETVKKLLRALVRAEEFVSGNPEEAQKIVAGSGGMEIGMVRELWPVFSYKINLDQALLLSMEDESRWAIRSGFVARQKIPNYLQFIYLDGLLSVRPEAVSILR